MKFLILFAFFSFVFWLLRRGRVARSARPAPPEAERMVVCTHCGVHQPVSESVLADGRYYCCAEHRREASLPDD